ncbi:MAG: pyruvate ferredoxin oxidoreductase, partial [Actinobacteria bacterium]|nr:pyruvate ferredoxin oxidoreductase [Actinomycetota bacterium]
MGERHLLTGNHAAAYGAKLARAEVISAYPITPQTTIVELLSEMVASGELDARYITVESEHSAMAAVIGASAAGCRTYTATSGQGLALMHEMLHWSVGARTPVVLTNVTRAMAPGWSIWSEQTDFLSQRDVGWMMLFAETVQEAQDFVIWMYRVAEQVYLPGMVAMDAFILSHTSEPLIVHDQAAVDAFLPRFDPLTTLDPAEPRAYGGLVNRDHYFELRYKVFESMERAAGLLVEAGKEFGDTLGFEYGPVDAFMM